MNPAQAVAVLLCLGSVLLVVLGFEVAVFRLACMLCKVPQPGLPRTVGVVVVLLTVPAVVDAAFGGVLYEVYTAARYPLWEAGVVQFFLALPAHMAICSALHAKLVRVRVREGLAVWLVEKVIKLALLAAAAGVVALVVLARQA